MNLAGQVIPHTRCPMDTNFRRDISKFVAKIASTGIKTIMLDDDFRLSQHGPDFCCACDAHMAQMRLLCGEGVTREQLRHLVFESEANQYRAAWMTAQRQSMEQLAQDIRAAVDTVSKVTKIVLCTPHCSYGVDGTNPLKTAKILAGENTPILRLQGAPYWVTHTNTPMAAVLEIASSCAYFFENQGAELMAEGDVYPRPRYNMPSSYLELYDAAIRADGRYDGILKYMIDYNATAGFETGYLRRHTKNLPLMEKIGEMFRGKSDCGINVSIERDVFSQADLELGQASVYYPYPLAGVMMSSSSLPTAYGEGGICHAVRDENGILQRQKDCSEACQYYAILFAGFDLFDEKYAELRRLVLEVFGAQRTEPHPEIVEINAFIGAYLRLEVLLKLGQYDLLLRDVKGFFGHMGKGTGTLWEYRQPGGSRDHGFASYALVAIRAAMDTAGEEKHEI